jgi:hypothetical protein
LINRIVCQAINSLLLQQITTYIHMTASLKIKHTLIFEFTSVYKSPLLEDVSKIAHFFKQSKFRKKFILKMTFLKIKLLQKHQFIEKIRI